MNSKVSYAIKTCTKSDAYILLFLYLKVKEAIKHHSKKRKAARMDSFSYTVSHSLL